jgi:mono/diheme cytochrome c family protein
VPALRTTDDEPLANPLAYYTANRLRNGETAVGGTTRLPRPDETAPGAKEAQTAELASAGVIAAGAKVYRYYCVACHQPDGRGLQSGVSGGIAVGPANFVDDKTRLAKTDAQLLQSIADGIEVKGMPAFGASLSVAQRRAVLAYLRATFGEMAESAGQR